MLLSLSSCVTIKGDLVLIKQGEKNETGNVSAEKSDSGRVSDDTVRISDATVRSTLFGGHVTTRPSSK